MFNSNGKESTKTFVGFGNPDFNKIEDTQQLLIIYDDVKDSNDKLIKSIDGINDNDWFSDFYDNRREIGNKRCGDNFVQNNEEAKSIRIENVLDKILKNIK